MENDLANKIVEIWKSGITMLVMQDVSLAVKPTQRALILEHGKVGLEGASRDLMNNEEVIRVYVQLG